MAPAETGIIEDIGLSSTRLRTMDRTVVSIPNAKIALLSSENFAFRDKFWFHHILSLRYDTSKTQIERVVAEIHTAMGNTPEVEKETHRANLIGAREASFQMEVSAYVIASNYDLFLTTQQELLLRILETISDSGIYLALPSPTVYLEAGGSVEKISPGQSSSRSGQATNSGMKSKEGA